MEVIVCECLAEGVPGPRAVFVRVVVVVISEQEKGKSKESNDVRDFAYQQPSSLISFICFCSCLFYLYIQS